MIILDHFQRAQVGSVKRIIGHNLLANISFILFFFFLFDINFDLVLADYVLVVRGCLRYQSSINQRR